MYDARGGEASNNGTIFAAALAGVVAIGVAAVMFWPSGQDGPTTEIANASAKTISINAVFPNTEERKFAELLKAVDDAAYMKLENEFLNRGLSDVQRHELVMKTSETVAMDNIDALARSDVKYMNMLMDDIIGGLQKASKSRAKLCNGSSFKGLDTMSPAQAENFGRDLLRNEALREFTIKLNARLLEAILDGRKNPKSYGTFNAADKGKIDALGPKLMSNPKIMRVLLSAGASASPEDVLAKLDLCDLSATVLREVDRLPKDTKARLWASTFAEIKKKGKFNLDPSQLSGLSGF